MAKEPVGGSHGWAKESVARARLVRAGNQVGYATGIANKPGEDEEEENAAGNHKQPSSNPVGVSHGWGNENAPTSASRTLGIHGGAAGRFTKYATTLLAEENTPSVGTKAQALHRVLMGGIQILKNTVGGGKRMGKGTGKTAAPTAGQ